MKVLGSLGIVVCAVGLAFLPRMGYGANQASSSPGTIILDKNVPQELFIDTEEALGNKKVQLFEGESRVVKADGVKKVYVSNPEIAKVNISTVRSRNYLVVTGKKAGYTDIIRVLGSGKFEKIPVEVKKVSFDVQYINAELSRLFPQNSISVKAEGPVLVLEGNAASSYQLDGILAYLKSYTDRVTNLAEIGGIKQVKLEAKIVELSRTKLKAAGINLLGLGNSASVGLFTASSLQGYSLERGGFSADSYTTPVSDAFSLLIGAGDIGTILSILEQKGISKTLSNPSVIAEDGKTAKLFVGGSIPVPVPQSGSNVITIEWKDYGIKLDFLPKVDKEGKIMLKVKAEAGDLNPNKGVSIQGTIVPSIDTRSIDSEVRLAAGEDLVIGGLLFSKDTNILGKTPLLGDIPIIGAFFKNVQDSNEELELVVILRPVFVQKGEGSYQERPTEPFSWSNYLTGKY